MTKFIMVALLVSGIVAVAGCSTGGARSSREIASKDYYKRAVYDGNVYSDPKNEGCEVGKYDGAQPQCVLLHDKFGLVKDVGEVERLAPPQGEKALYFVCSGNTTVILEESMEEAVRKFKLMKDAGLCNGGASSEAPAQGGLRCMHYTRNTTSWTASHNFGDSAWKDAGEEYFETPSLVPANTSLSKYENCHPASQ